MRLDSDYLRAKAREDGRPDIAAWIDAKEDEAHEAAERRAQTPLVLPAGTIEFGKRYDVVVRQRGGINPPSERRLRNVAIGGYRWGERALVYPSGKVAVGSYDFHRITLIEEAK